MAVLQTGQTFASGDQVTADKLMDIANDATFITTANETADGQTIQVDANGGHLKVPSDGIGFNQLSSDATVDANRAVGTNHIRDGAVTASKLDSAAVSVLMPTATILPYAGSTAPTGYLVCAGQSLLTSTYADLHEVIGYDYGGSGASFNLPDLRGRVIAGLDDMGGTAAGRLTNQTNLGDTSGTQSVTLTAAQSGLPSHNHTIAMQQTNANFDSGTFNGLRTGSGKSTGTTGGTDATQSHTNVQPTMTLNYIIKT